MNGIKRGDEIKLFTKRFDKTIWVKVGPNFKPPSRRLQCGVAVPLAFWKVILTLNDEGQPIALAFLIPQRPRDS